MKLTIIALLFLPCFAFSNFEQEKWVEVGDMLVPESSLISQNFVERGYKKKNARLWKNGILPLSFSNQVSQQERQEFFQACDEIGEFANIECIERRNTDRDYIYVNKTNKNYCGSSAVGRKGGKQTLLVRCWRKRTIQHELMHALGMLHEHNRVDRDEHIKILWENMKSKSRWNYQKVSMNSVSHQLSFYDYDSIMHYDSRSGSKNGKMVFYRIDKGMKKGYIKQSNVMSYGDHYFLYALYGGVKP